MKTMRAGEQWWGTWWVIPKCMLQMSSPEWLWVGTAQPRPHQNAHRSGRKCSRGPPHQCPGPGKRAGTLREKEGIKREGGKIIKEEGEKWNGTKRGRKREGRGKQRKRESENVSGLKTKSGKKKTKKLISCIEKGEKNSNTSKQKHSTKEENYTMSTRWWLSGGWVENALVWRMN